MWIAYPVSIDKKVSKTFWRKTSVDFFRGAPSISRAFALYGRPGIFSSSTQILVTPTNGILAGYLYSLIGIGSIAILKFPEAAAASLARPNVNSTALVLNSVGLIPNSPQITETVVYTKNSDSRNSFRFAVECTGSDEYAEDEYYPRFIAAIAFERMILDASVEALNSNFVSARKARRSAANISFWLSSPSIESDTTRLRFREIRQLLDLDNRSNEIVEALKQIISRGNTALIAGTATSAAFLSLFDSPSLKVTQEIGWLGISFAAGITAWFLVRGTRQ